MKGPLIGRERALDDLAARFAEGYRLVTLVGPAGVGKTRLAERFAEAQGGALCDLSEVTTLDGLCEAVREALALPEAEARGTERALRQLGAQLARAERLLVLDNFEQLVEHAVRIGAWLERAPALQLLVTSRERLHLAAESVLPLEPLAVPPRDDAGAGFAAVRLLEARARAAGVDLTGVDGAALGRIARALDGLPLAIELAAPRLAVLAPEELAAALERPLALLVTHSRDVPPRHASLARALATSWQLLGPGEQRALAALAAFRGAFDRAAAAAVLGRSDADTTELLAALLEKSLVAPQPGAKGARRFRLYLALRSFAEERARELGLWDEACRRHAEWFVARDPIDVDNLAAASRRALAAGHLAIAARAAIRLARHRGAADRHLALLDAAAERGGELPAPLPAELFSTRGRLRFERGRFVDSLADLDAAAALLAGPARAETDEARCSVLRRLRRFDEARAAGERALAVYRELASPRALVAEGALATVDLEAGAAGDALVRFERIRSEAEALGDARNAAMAIGFLGHAHHERGELERAEARYLEAAARFAAAGDARLAAAFSGYAATARHEAGDLEAAEPRYHTCAAELERIGALPFAALFAACHGALCAAAGRLDEAEQRLSHAAALLAEVDDPALAEALSLHRQQLAVARALADLERRQSGWYAAHRELLAGRPARGGSDDVRFAERLLTRAVARLRRAAERAGALPRRLRMGDGWIEPSWAERVDLKRRRVLWRVLEALVEARLARPGQPVSREALRRAGWGAERMQAHAAAHRLRVALSELRTRALGDALERSDEGYWIAGSVEIERVV